LYAPFVYSWCRHFDVAREDTAEIVQEVFLAVHTRIGDFRHDRSGDTFRGWLWTITRNKIRDHRRKAVKVVEARGGTDARRRLMELPEDEPETLDSATEAVQSKRFLEARLEPVRAQFETRTWDAFWRATIEGHDTADIAADLGITVNAVRKAKCRVLRRLREEFKDLSG
jgi:RNA polymerase sigma-70 factor (ECF subfamily)